MSRIRGAGFDPPAFDVEFAAFAACRRRRVETRPTEAM